MEKCYEMNDLNWLGKWVLVMGLVLAAAGAVFLLAGKVPWFGNLPGDIKVERKNFTFYFPLMTCLFLSALTSLALWLINKFK